MYLTWILAFLGGAVATLDVTADAGILTNRSHLTCWKHGFEDCQTLVETVRTELRHIVRAVQAEMVQACSKSTTSAAAPIFQTYLVRPLCDPRMTDVARKFHEILLGS